MNEVNGLIRATVPRGSVPLFTRTHSTDDHLVHGVHGSEAFTAFMEAPHMYRPLVSRSARRLPGFGSGFPRIRFRDLRHSAAILRLAQGVSPRYITELLGHSQVSFTMQTYAHVLPEVQKQTAMKMDEFLRRTRLLPALLPERFQERISGL